MIYCYTFQTCFLNFISKFFFWNDPSVCCLIVPVICSAKLHLDILVLLLCCNFFAMDSCLSRHFKSSQFLALEKVSVSEWFLELQFSFKDKRPHGGRKTTVCTTFTFNKNLVFYSLGKTIQTAYFGILHFCFKGRFTFCLSTDVYMKVLSRRANTQRLKIIYQVLFIVLPTRKWQFAPVFA